MAHHAFGRQPSRSGGANGRGIGSAATTRRVTDGAPPATRLIMSAIRVLLADDHELVRTGFRALLGELGVEVVAEASNGREALANAETHRPDVVLMDIAMPDLNGLEATAEAVRRLPGMRVIMLSMHANAEYARRALRAGAAGYLLKNSTAAELDFAIKAVMRGESYLSPVVAKYIADEYAPGTPGDTRSHERLTRRQLEILQL